MVTEIMDTGKAKKRSRDPDKTRRRLLQAGTRLFSRRGYDGASVDEIVARAGVNKRMLYHYYENKEGLYVAVLQEIFGRVEKMEMETLKSPHSAPHAIESILISYSAFLQSNPEFVNLLMWENLNQGRFLSRHPSLLSKNPVIERLEEVLAIGVERGEIVEGVEARHLLVSLIGLCFVHHANKYSLKHSIGLDFLDADVMEESMKTARAILLNGIIR